MFEKFWAAVARLHWYGLLLMASGVFLTVPSRLVGGSIPVMLGVGTMLLAAAAWAALRERNRTSPLDPHWKPDDRRLLVAIVALGVALRILWVSFVYPIQISDFWIYWELARGLVERGEYSELLGGLGTSRARRPPGYPFLLAAAMHVFGPWPYLPALLNLGFYVGWSLLAASLARRTLGRNAALAAAALLAVWPSDIAYTGMAATEQLYTLCILLSIWFLALEARLGWRAWLLTGLATGIGVLTRQTLMIMPAIWAVYLLRQRRWSWRALAQLAAAFAVMMAVLAPWMIRNYRILGKPVITTIGGSALFLGSNPLATAAYHEQGLQEVIASADYDEIRSDRELQRIAGEWIRANPGAFLRLSLEKQIIMLGEDTTGFYWSLRWAHGYSGRFYAVLQGLNHLWWVAVWGLAFAGAFGHRMALIENPILAVMIWTVLVLWLSLVPFTVSPRFHIPFMPMILIVSGVALGGIRRAS